MGDGGYGGVFVGCALLEASRDDGVQTAEDGLGTEGGGRMTAGRFQRTATRLIEKLPAELVLISAQTLGELFRVLTGEATVVNPYPFQSKAVLGNS